MCFSLICTLELELCCIFPKIFMFSFLLLDTLPLGAVRKTFKNIVLLMCVAFVLPVKKIIALVEMKKEKRVKKKLQS